MSRRGPVTVDPWPAPCLVGLFAWPKREAIVVLRGEHDISRSRAFEDVGPVRGIVHSALNIGAKSE